MFANLRKVQKLWAQISQFFGWEGDYPGLLGISIRQWYRQPYCLERITGPFTPGLVSPLAFPPQGVPLADGNTDGAGQYRQVVLPITGRGNDGSGFGRGGGVRPLPP